MSLIRLGLLSGLLFQLGCAQVQTKDRSATKTTTAPRVAHQPPAPPKSVIPSVSADQLMTQALRLFQAKDFNKSYDYYWAASQKHENEVRKKEALTGAYRSLQATGRAREMIEVSRSAQRLANLTSEERKVWIDAELKALDAAGLHKEGLLRIEALMADPAMSSEIVSLRSRGSELIENRFPVEELPDLTREIADKEFRALVFFRLGEKELEDGRPEEARRQFLRAQSESANSGVGTRAADFISQLDSIRRVEPRTIGVVLPLTGKHSGISSKTLRGLQMGLGLYNNLPSSFRLAVIDSEGNPDLARRGVERLVKEDNVIAIVSSFLSRTSPAITAKANELNVPVIDLSQKSGVTETGPFVFRNSLTSEMQVRELVRVAMDEQGLRRFALVFPNDAYGVEYANLFWDEVLARGGQVTAAQTYSPKETDFRSVVQRLVGTFYSESRGAELSLRTKEWRAGLKGKSARQEPPTDLLPSLVDFDAVFIPDRVSSMGQIAAMLSYNGVKGVRLLGTNLWNRAEVSKRAGLFVNQLLFVDSIVPTSPTFANSSFVRDYKNIFGEDPGLFEIQAYDTSSLLRQMISEGSSSRESLARALTRVANFQGSVSPLRMNDDREIQRPTLALTVDNGQIVPYQNKARP